MSKENTRFGIENFPKTREAKIENYEVKNQFLRDAGLSHSRSDFKEISLEEYYRLIFGDKRNLKDKFLGEINLNDLELPFEEKLGTSQIENKYVYNSIVLNMFQNKRNQTWIVTKNLEELEKVKNQENSVSSPITYIGRNRTTNNARFLYAITIDLDYVAFPEIKDFVWQIETGEQIVPNIVVNSGNGLHVTYLFDVPCPLFRNCKEILDRLKRYITYFVWNEFTSKDENKQFQSVVQGYRLPETQTKFGTKVTAFMNLKSKVYSLQYLNEFLKNNKCESWLSDEEIKELEQAKQGQFRTQLEIAKEQWPEWFQDRIVDKKPRKYMQYKRDLYDWWFRILSEKGEKNKVTVGHRYFCALALVSFATKCGVEKSEVKEDLYSLLEPFERKTNEDDNHFSLGDFDDALKIYGTDKAYKFRAEYISNQCNIDIPKRKRNGRTRENHLKVARTLKKLKKELGETQPNFYVKKKIENYFKENPDSSKSYKEISETLDISYRSAKKWIPIVKNENFSENKLNNKEQKLFNVLKENKEISKSELARRSGVGYKTVLKYYDKVLEEVRLEEEREIDALFY